MKIAVSSNEYGTISSHLGKAKVFLIFEKTENEVEFSEARTTEGNHSNHIIEDIKDCDAIISGKIGDGMVKSLKDLGIEAIVEKNLIDPLEAVKKNLM